MTHEVTVLVRWLIQEVAETIPMNKELKHVSKDKRVE